MWYKAQVIYKGSKTFWDKTIRFKSWQIKTTRDSLINIIWIDQDECITKEENIHYNDHFLQQGA